MSRNAVKVRMRRLADAGGDSDYLATTLDAWAFKGEPVTGPMPGDIVRVVRLKDKKNSS